MPGKQALLVIDVQTGMFTLPIPLYQNQILLENIIRLIKKARDNNVPVIYVQYCGEKGSLFEEGTPGWKIHPEITPQENDIVILKKHADAFHKSNLEQILKDHSIDTLIICGLVTEGCFDTTIRRAYSLDFNVITVSDCHSTTDNNVLKAKQVIDHHNQLFKIFSDVKSSNEIVFN
jgi:nicotinamidase-related amidase